VLWVVGLATVAIVFPLVVLFTDRGGGSSLGSGYLAETPHSVAFIQWAVSGTRVSGTIHVDAFSGSPPTESISTTTARVSGQIQGAKINLSFNGNPSVFGTLSGDGFTIGIPQSDGTLAPATFHSGSALDFNGAVRAMRARMNTTNRSVAAQQQLQQEESAINTAAQSVYKDLSTLKTDEASVSATLAKLPAALQQENAALATTASQSASAEQQPGNTSCGPATTAESDATSVENDANQIGNISDTVESDTHHVTTDITNLKSSYEKLSSAESALPSYGSDLPTQTRVKAAITTASKVVQAAITQTNSVIAQANSYDTQAWKDAGAALQAEHCGGAPTPAKIQAIT